MGRPRTDTKMPATRERLLDAALIEFGARGLADARLSDIAEAVGITRPSLLFHFPTKDALYAATLERAFAMLASILDSSMTHDDDVHRRVRVIVENISAAFAENAALARLIVREIIAQDGLGQDMLVSSGVLLLDHVEADVRARLGGDHTFPIRTILVGALVDALLRAATSPTVRAALWTDGASTADVASLALAGGDTSSSKRNLKTRGRT